MRRWLVSAASVVALSCTMAEPLTCGVAGTTQACVCPGGGSGAQVCTTAGSFGPCDCGGGGPDGGRPADAAEPSGHDRFFIGVVVGALGDGAFRLIIYDPAFASLRPEGHPAHGATEPVGELILELDGGRTTRVVAPATMTGVVGGGGSTTIDAAFDDRVVMGVVREGGVESSLRGTDVADADAVVLCGTYEGVSVDGSAVSGTWSFTIDASGEIVGRFDQGALTGRVSGSTVSIDWIGEGAAAGYSGQAMGTLDGDRSAVSGTWGGSGGSTSGGGTFASSAGGCPSGVVTPPARSDALPSGCDCVVGGACCGGLCCVP